MDQGKTIVLDIFYVNCGPCNAIVPYLQDLNMKWGVGYADVEFISLTDVDTNAEIIPFDELYSLTFPAAGRDAGGTEAVTPHTSGTFGSFMGYPPLIVISPDKTMDYDIWGSSHPNTSDLLDAAIAATGANGIVTTIYESDNISTIQAFPNPVIDELQISFNLERADDIQLYVINASGKLISEMHLGKLIVGDQLVTLDLQDLTTGIYFIEMHN